MKRPGCQGWKLVLSVPSSTRVLNESGWADRLSPLFYMYINLYGRFELDLDERIDFERRAA